MEGSVLCICTFPINITNLPPQIVPVGKIWGPGPWTIFGGGEEQGSSYIRAEGALSPCWATVITRVR